VTKKKKIHSDALILFLNKEFIFDRQKNRISLNETKEEKKIHHS
jgi:hypothetical protein